MVATLARIFGLAHLSLAEDVVQEAFVKALRIWPLEGVPEHPSAWLLRVARNQALDLVRRQGSWQHKREELGRSLAAWAPPEVGEGSFAQELEDDQLRLIFACCHPRVPRDAQVALTLKTAGGFSVAEIARAFLAKPSTIAQRLVRAKRHLREAGVDLALPAPADLQARRAAVLEVLYLLFNEGHSALEGEALVRRDLCFEALRIARLLAGHPKAGGPEVHAVVSLFAFQAARLETRADSAGDLMLLSEQDRGHWDRRLIHMGLRHLRRAASGDRVTSYHLEAEIAYCHALAPSYKATDWRAILRSYDALLELNPSPVITLNRAVALGQVEGAKVALEAVEELRDNKALRDYYPLHVTLGQLQRELGREEEARASFERALALSTSEPVRRFLARCLGTGSKDLP